ncbi:MarR family winged helix-turn-helix transcriptional regulator [Salipiger abyssi]|uniref:MarR family winged helix-turn-helix transcriptional regulator n=1 Tax=Salipiger abyssi TaxID=1250539 RepID=UPI00405A4455
MDPAAPTDPDRFDLEHFLPFLLNQAAETVGRAFQPAYREAHGLSRTQWRVLAITGRYARLSARDICVIAHEEKSRISRAVAALEQRGLIRREDDSIDRRAAILSLTEAGRTLYAELGEAGLAFDRTLAEALGPEAEATLRQLLSQITRITSERPE